MKKLSIVIICCTLIVFSCSKKNKYEKGFAISPETETKSNSEKDGILKDSITVMKTRPSSVLLTRYPEYRLTTIYKLNYNKKDEHYYTGQNNFYRNYSDLGQSKENQWHYNFMPGLQAVYGYNLVNASLRNVVDKNQTLFFDKPVLIKTLYYPSFTSDTLFNKPVNRNYYLISVYDEDTNEDGYIRWVY